jgi:hypothetical protein
VGECDLPGQPDSIATKEGILAIAIENERNEELDEGALPFDTLQVRGLTVR